MNWADYFYYDESSPSCLRWKVGRASGRNGNQLHIEAGDVAGSISPTSGYYQVKLNKRLYLCHRVIMLMFGHSISPKEVVDHMDRNPLNNVVSNLRVVPKPLNPRNASKRKDNSSGVTGVTRISNGQGSYYWSAQCENGDGTYCRKRFAVNRYGEDEAFRLACEWRETKIDELNAQGAGYTSDHGK